MDVTLANFEDDVIATSMHTPVLVDFWAPWCAPCKSLGPLLEKVELAYAGRFKLVKIDSDQEQQLSAAFGVRSLPTCILVVGGQPVDGFAGAIPESQIKEFLDKHLPPAEPLLGDAPLDAEPAADSLDALLATGDTATALAQLAQILAQEPGNEDNRFRYAQLLISAGELDAAQAALVPVLAQIPPLLRFESLQQWLQAVRFASTDAQGAWDMAQFDEKIALNKRDFETRFAKSQVLMARSEWTAALDELLEIVQRDKKWNFEAARKNFVAILELLTPPQPKAGLAISNKTAGGIELAGKTTIAVDPQVALVSQYRRRLGMALN